MAVSTQACRVQSGCFCCRGTPLLRKPVGAWRRRSQETDGRVVVEHKPVHLFWATLVRDCEGPAVKKAILVEFWAQVLFNFASCSAVCVCSELSGDLTTLVPVELAAFHFLLLYVLIGATQPISEMIVVALETGGHFNPMVSVMMGYMNVIPAVRVLPYVAAQLVGGTVGSTLQYQTLPVLLQNAQHAGVQAVPADRTVVQAFLGESVAAFILMAVVCFVGLDPKGDPKKIPISMALIIALLILVIGPISSMCINPARAFGPAVASGFWDAHWLWWTAPFVGGFCATIPYKCLLQLEEDIKRRVKDDR